MHRTPAGTSVGVDDPYDHVDRCEHLTDDGRCRLAWRHPAVDPAFTAERADREYACVVSAEGTRWADCRHYRVHTQGNTCERCGLEERLVAHDPDSRPLLQAHHLAYADDPDPESHEITVALCRWCHAKVHHSWGRITDDVSPDPEAIAERERRITAECDEMVFRAASELVGGQSTDEGTDRDGVR